MAKKIRESQESIANMRAALSEDSEPDVAFDEIDVPAADDEPPAGFDPSDYDDSEGEPTVATKGTTADDADPDAEEVDEPAEGKAKVKAKAKAKTAEADETDPDADPDADAEQAIEAAADDAGHDETQDDDGDGTAEKPLRLSDDELDSYVALEGFDEPVQLRKLAELAKEPDTHKEIYLKRSREHAALMQQAKENFQKSEQVLAERTERAELLDAPHAFLDAQIPDWVNSGAMPQEMADEMVQLFNDYFKAGKYDPNKPMQIITQRKEARDRAAQAAQQMREQVKADVENIERVEKITLTPEHRKKIGEYIMEYANANGGQPIRVESAYYIMKARGLLKIAPPAPKQPAKVAARPQQKRRLGRGTIGPGKSARTAPAKSKNNDMYAAARRVRMALASN